MYRRFHHKEKKSQVLSKAQYFIQCHITSKFIETVPKVSLITIKFKLWCYCSESICRYYYKNKQNSKIPEFLEKNASIYYGNSRRWYYKKSVSNAKYETTNVKIYIRLKWWWKAIFIKSKKWRGHGCKKKISSGYVLLCPWAS